MSALEDALAGLAKPGSKSKKVEWRSLNLDDLGQGMVLAIDQSLGATGWALVYRTPTWMNVLSAGTISTDETECRGHEQTLLRTVEMHDSLLRLIDMALSLGAQAFVHETPPVGSRMSRPESSLLSAAAFRIALEDRGQWNVHMLGAQPAKKLICGNANATKPVAHTELAKCASWIRGYELITNEAKRDALMLALLYLSRQK